MFEDFPVLIYGITYGSAIQMQLLVYHNHTKKPSRNKESES
jgi:hypothetical protein